jgi:hypothetical protein
MYSRGLFKHTHSLTAFWGLPFEDIAVIGPRGGSKSKNWRWAAIFKEGLVAQRRSCKQNKAESSGDEGRASAFLSSSPGCKVEVILQVMFVGFIFSLKKTTEAA